MLLTVRSNSISGSLTAACAVTCIRSPILANALSRIARKLFRLGSGANAQIISRSGQEAISSGQSLHYIENTKGDGRVNHIDHEDSCVDEKMRCSNLLISKIVKLLGVFRDVNRLFALFLRSGYLADILAHPVW